VSLFPFNSLFCGPLFQCSMISLFFWQHAEFVQKFRRCPHCNMGLLRDIFLARKHQFWLCTYWPTGIELSAFFSCHVYCFERSFCSRPEGPCHRTLSLSFQTIASHHFLKIRITSHVLETITNSLPQSEHASNDGTRTRGYLDKYFNDFQILYVHNNLAFGMIMVHFQITLFHTNNCFFGWPSL
jgi:hypothetical protein